MKQTIIMTMQGQVAKETLKTSGSYWINEQINGSQFTTILAEDRTVSTPQVCWKC